MKLRLLALPLTLVACTSAPPALPDGAGAGVVACDREPPAGAVTWQRPAWRTGDRFVLVRGENLRGTFTVTAAAADHYSIDTGNGLEIRRDLDLGNLGEWDPAGEPVHLLSPADTRYHWPLWIGKTWTCEFVDRSRGGPAIPMQASYVVEDLDTITVPAGTFQALRVVRTVRLLAVPGYFSRWQVAWYAPDVGTEVRQLYGDTMVELVEVQQAR